MAAPKRTAAGFWWVQIEVRSVHDAATFPTKREATEWAAQRKGWSRCQITPQRI